MLQGYSSGTSGTGKGGSDEIPLWTGMLLTGVTVLQGLLQWILLVLGYVLILWVMFSGARRLEIGQDKNSGRKQCDRKKEPLSIIHRRALFVGRNIDTISGTALTLDQNSITETTNHGATFSNKTNKGFDISIPELKHGESATITYRAKVDYDVLASEAGVEKGHYGTVTTTGNQIRINGTDDNPDNNTSETHADHNISFSSAGKGVTEGHYNEETGKRTMNWQIKANEEHRTTISYQITYHHGKENLYHSWYESSERKSGYPNLLRQGLDTERKLNGNTYDVTNGEVNMEDENGTVINKKRLEIKVKKVDADKKDIQTSDKYLDGAMFSLRNAEDVLLTNEDVTLINTATGAVITPDSDGKFVIPKTGITISGLADGTYHLVEVKAPAGYIITNTTTVFTVNNGVVQHSDGTTGVSFEISNPPGAELPATGGSGTRVFYLIGLMLVGIGGIILLLKRQRSM